MKNIYIISPELAASDKKIAIFGTGSAGLQVFFELLHYGVYVDSFCDSYDSKLGKRVFNKKVISFDLLKNQKNEYTVIIASTFWKDILKNLTELGFKDLFVYQRHDYIPDECKAEDFIVPETPVNRRE